jgi:hypothetical protein
MLYAYGPWRIDAPPTGIRWLIDGPPMTAWRAASNWLLWKLHLNGATEPVHYVDGSSVSHMPGAMHALGLLNEAMLAVVLGMFFLLVIQALLAKRLQARHAA